jgi:hypothetical protein
MDRPKLCTTPKLSISSRNFRVKWKIIITGKLNFWDPIMEVNI